MVFVAGTGAGLHVWALPSAIPYIRDDLSLTLFEVGVLLGVVQVAGMMGGLAVSVLAELLGERRCLIAGLLLLSLGAGAGGFAGSLAHLMVSRSLEGAGFVLIVVTGPALIRRTARPARLNLAIGFWGAYQGAAALVGLCAGALVLHVATWQVWWWMIGAATFVLVPVAMWFLPSDGGPSALKVTSALGRVARTVRARPPWVAGLVFGCYTIQWMAVLSFLPIVYEESGLSRVAAGLFTAGIGGLNAVGSIGTAPLLQRGVPPRAILGGAFGLMALTSVLSLQVPWTELRFGLGLSAACVGAFSLVGASIPATLLRMSVELTPEGGSTSATVGLMQQIFNAGSFAGPSLAAVLATLTGSWHATWWLTCGFAALGTLLSLYLGEKRLTLAHVGDGPARPDPIVEKLTSNEIALLRVK